MRIIVEDPSPEFERALLDLFEKYREEVEYVTASDARPWTVEKARRYLRTLTPDAFTIARRVIDADGRVDAEHLRDVLPGQRLRGGSFSLSRAINRGIRHGWWPKDIAEAVVPEYGPGSGRRRAEAYVLAPAHLPAFREALREADYTDGEPDPDRPANGR